jgi:hypothetical protein
MYRTIAASLMVGSLILTPIAWAEHPHFISCRIVSVSSDSITVSAKEAGLGSADQIDAQLTATALCINRGGHNPDAANKADVAAAGTFPVQTGKANYTLTGTADFQPECSPPMSVSYTDILITDLTHGITCEP